MKVAIILLFSLFNYHFYGVLSFDQSIKIYIEDSCEFPLDLVLNETNSAIIHLSKSESFNRNKHQYCFLTVIATEGYGISINGTLGQLVFIESHSVENSRIHFRFDSSINESVSFSKIISSNKLVIVVEKHEQCGLPLIQTSLNLNAIDCKEPNSLCHNSIPCNPNNPNLNCIKDDENDENDLESSGYIKLNNEDALLCDPGLSACANGTCIPIDHFCNENNDCGDNSDETSCGIFNQIEPRNIRKSAESTVIYSDSLQNLQNLQNKSTLDSPVVNSLSSGSHKNLIQFVMLFISYLISVEKAFHLFYEF